MVTLQCTNGLRIHQMTLGKTLYSVCPFGDEAPTSYED